VIVLYSAGITRRAQAFDWLARQNFTSVCILVDRLTDLEERRPKPVLLRSSMEDSFAKSRQAND
jgi:hypothetical protein